MKALVIGLGGAGVSIAGHLKAKLIDDKTYKSDTFRFIFVDTAGDARDRLQKMYPHIPDLFNEFIDLGPCIPHQVYQANKPGWVSKPNLLLNRTLSDGAGAFRQQGRLALFWGQANVAQKIREALNSLLREGGGVDEVDLVILPITSSCGGTGSAIFLDILALIGTVHQQLTTKDPKVFPIIILPEFYISSQDPTTAEKYRANAFAFFQELSDVSALQGAESGVERFLKDFSFLGGTTSPKSLYTLAFCVDTVTSEGRILNAPEPLYSTVAEGLRAFLKIGLNELTTKLVNKISELYHEEPQYRNVMGTLGVRACRFPTELFYRYLQDRFVFEAFSALLGPSLDEIYPDPGEKRDYVENVFKKVIGRFLIQAFCPSADPEANECNLEINLTRQLTGRLQLSDSRFRTNGRLDRDKIRDRALVAQHVKDAERLIQSLQEELRYRLAGEAEPWARSRLLRKIEQELMKEVEETILRWGARATQDLVSTLDVRCSEIRYSPQADGDLQDQLEDISNQQQALLNQIKTTLDAWPKRADEEDLQNLNGLLTQWLQAFAKAFILRQQIELLDELSQGERGILDRWERHLGLLIEALQGERARARKAYLEDLPKKFLETTNDATTIFLPNVAQFVQNGTWTPHHEFSFLYCQLVERGANNEALRFDPGSRGLAPQRKGFHALLTDLKTVSGKEFLFASDVQIGLADDLRSLAQGLKGQFEKYILERARQSEAVRSILEGRLHDRFQKMPLDERSKVFQRLVADLVFCQSQAQMKHVLKVVEVDDGTKQMLVDAEIIPDKPQGGVVPLSASVNNRAITLTMRFATTHELIQRVGTWERYREAAANPNRLVPAFLDARFEQAGGLLQAVAPGLSFNEIGKVVGRTFAKAYLLTKLAQSEAGKAFISSLFQRAYFGPSPPSAPFLLRDNFLLVPIVSVTRQDRGMFLMADPGSEERFPLTNHAVLLRSLAENPRVLRSLEAWAEVAKSRLPGRHDLLESLQQALKACLDILTRARESDSYNATTYDLLKQDVQEAYEEWERAIRSAPPAAAPHISGEPLPEF